MGREAVYPSGHMRGPLGSCLPCRPQGSGPRPKPDHPTQRQSPATIKSRFRHRPWRPTPTSPPAVSKGQAPVRRCRLGNPPPLGPNGLVGLAPFVAPSGSWLPLRPPAGAHRNKIGATAQEGEAAGSDGNPIPGDGKPAAPKPSQQSALRSTCRVCPTPADASINGRGINDQGTYSGGVARPAAPTSGKGGCRGEKPSPAEPPPPAERNAGSLRVHRRLPQRPPPKVRERAVGPASCPARVCRSTRAGLAHTSETPL